MGIYISDLEISKDKAVRVVIIRDDGICVDEYGNTYDVVSPPPHGRLINADKLRELDCWLDDEVGGWFVQQAIDDAPTVIPAEPCNDLSKPNNAPTVIGAEPTTGCEDCKYWDG